MDIDQNKYCIFVASHLSNVIRIPYLIECIQSLLSQQKLIPIYLSISFHNSEIREEYNKQMQIYKVFFHNQFLNIRTRHHKTSQMRHYQLLLQETITTYRPDWIMFCDDDDTYSSSRSEDIIATLKRGYRTTMDLHDKLYAGLYENIHGNSHHEVRHEYWSYCINTSIMESFFATIQHHPTVLDNKCCDVLFAEYLRRLSGIWVFSNLRGSYYQYRVENNADSITGFIKSKQSVYSNCDAPPSMNEDTWLDYVIGWNDYLHENIDVYMHDTYLLALVGMTFDNIVRREFKENCSIIDYVDQCHITKLKKVYDSVRSVCDEIYQIPLQR